MVYLVAGVPDVHILLVVVVVVAGSPVGGSYVVGCSVAPGGPVVLFLWVVVVSLVGLVLAAVVVAVGPLPLRLLW